MVHYFERPLSSTLLNADSKVVVLEGARAVGKTSLVKQQLLGHGFSYVDLADNSTFLRAKEDPDAWVASLDIPVVIDEAQRLPELPLAVKRAVDESSGIDTMFVLTGSASICRKGLSGQNPLTRRSRRFTLAPLTQRELEREQRSIVDDLFFAEPDESYSQETSREDLKSLMAVGGFPHYAVEIPAQAPTMSENERGLCVRNDIEEVLGDTLLPEEHLDRTIAQAILGELLTHPGDILNVSRLASALHYDVRTIERYVSIFINRFLVHTLRNMLHKSGMKDFTRAKVHPADVSFSVEYLRMAGVDILDDSTAFGHVLESFVANQIVPAAQWSETKPDCFYWRDSGVKPREVDLVLLHNDKLVGIEVKASAKLRSDDFKGLDAMREKDSRFHRGYLVYTGSRLEKWSNGHWALPISALWDTRAFKTFKAKERSGGVETLVAKTQANVTGGIGQRPVDANLFLSYCHDDDDYLGGAIVRFAKAIVRSYQFQFPGRLNLFIDKESINWGEDWRRAIDQGVEATHFFIPAVTPSYVYSQACREEFLKFYGRFEGERSENILSLIWQDFTPAREAMPDDPVMKAIDKHQYQSVEDLKWIEEGSGAYREKVAKVVSRLRNVIVNAQEKPASQAADEADQDSEDEGVGLIEIAEKIDRTAPSVIEATGRLIGHIEDITRIMNSHPAPQSAKPAALVKWSADMAARTAGAVKSIKVETANISTAWESVFDASRSYITLLKDFPEGDLKSSSVNGFEETLLSLKRSFPTPGQFSEMRNSVTVLRSLSPRLQPIATAFEGVMGLFESMDTMTRDLVEQIRKGR